MAVPLPGPGGAMVGGLGLHLKHDALLPVGRNGDCMVSGPWDNAATFGDHAAALGTGRCLVRHSPLARRTTSGTGRNASHFRADRAGRPILGSRGRCVRLGGRRAWAYARHPRLDQRPASLLPGRPDQSSRASHAKSSRLNAKGARCTERYMSSGSRGRSAPR
jgi:hypothetical protein